MALLLLVTAKVGVTMAVADRYGWHRDELYYLASSRHPEFAAGAAVAHGAGRRRRHRRRGTDRARAGWQSTGADARGPRRADLAHVRGRQHPLSDGQFRPAGLGPGLPAVRPAAARGRPAGVAAAGSGVWHWPGDEVHGDGAGVRDADRTRQHQGPLAAGKALAVDWLRHRHPSSGAESRLAVRA